MAAKKIVIFMSCLIISVIGTSAHTAEWATISGKVVTEEGVPLCGMVLANGQHMFSCDGQGNYEMSVPVGDSGIITLYGFVEGFAPFKQDLNPDQTIGYEIKMLRTDSQAIKMTHQITPLTPGWVTISGTVKTEDGTPLCGMVLANGEHMFSCGGEGSYELDIPLTSEGNITLYGFAEGFAPYNETLSGIILFPTGNQDFTVKDVDGSDPLFDFRLGDSEDIENLPDAKDWSDYMPDVDSQGSTSSCTSWAVGYYYKTYQEVVEEGWDKNENAFSPMYLYSMQCREYEKYAYPSPWNFETAATVLKNNGCAKMSAILFEDLDTGGTTAQEKAEMEKQAYAAVNISEDMHNQAKDYRAGNINYFKTLGEVKNALTSGPVLLAINKYSNQVRTLNWNPSPENNYLIVDSSNDNVGHAVLCVGYDNTMFGEGALRFVNSWGEKWAIDGYSWIKYSDYENLVLGAITINDISNPKPPVSKLPDPPNDVSASDSEIPYVDIKWTKSDSAYYYRIYRATVGDFSTYEEIGISYNTNYRDEKAIPSVSYYYSVVSVNDIGESDHFDTDTDTKPYVDIGTASGQIIAQQPKLAWVSNNDEEISSHFIVSNIDPTATKMELFVSTASDDGPWYSFGWIGMFSEFDITWSEDSEYLGKQPYVKVVVSNAYGYSKGSDPARVGKPIAYLVPVAVVLTLDAQATETSVHLSWTTDGGKADFFEVWRWLASDDKGNQWVPVGSTPVGSTGADKQDYDDNTALPGKDYYYAVCAVYKGTYSKHKITENPVRIPVPQPNLRLYNVEYEYDHVSSPVRFGLTVWNDGGEAFNDYSITIKAYDWETEETSYVFAGVISESGIFRASVISQDQLPLGPGQEHTLVFSARIPPVYADEHRYSWIAEIDVTNEYDEKYEDDNRVVCSKSWWSANFPPLPNLSLDKIRYAYDEIDYPVDFMLFVSYKGVVPLTDYSVLITAYDWNDGKYVSMFEMSASEVAGPGQLPLQPGDDHILSFSREIPLTFANEHRYSWNIGINADGITDEPVRYKNDNSIQSSKLWWLKIPEPRSAKSGKNGARFAAEANPFGSKTGTTRPFSSRTRSFIKSGTADKEKYVGPIRFKKPSFCINRAE